MAEHVCRIAAGRLVAALLAFGAAASSADPGLDHRTMAHLDAEPYAMLSIDRLEYGEDDHGDTLRWDAEAWYGGDYNKLWLELEGVGSPGESPERTELAVLYDRLFSPFWSWRAGLAYDVRGDGRPDLGYVVVGLQGLAPHWLETEAALYLSEDGDVALRAEVEYDVRLTQRLILEPRIELDLWSDGVPEIGAGRGLASSELGLRLRYEIVRELAPYIGVNYERLYGDSRDSARVADEPTSRTQLVVGIRAWL